MKTIRVLIVDDQALFREGLRTLLSVHPDIDVVGEAANGREAVAGVGELRPDVVLMDLRMPVLTGAQATREIRALPRPCPVLVLTTFDDDEDVFDALRAGATGYLLKDTSSEKIAEAIRSAARGEAFLHPAVATKVVAEFSRLSSPPPVPQESPLDALSEREREVLQQLARGMSNKEIARELCIAQGTVKNHLTNIFTKLGTFDRTQAALKAREFGLV